MTTVSVWLRTTTIGLAIAAASCGRPAFVLPSGPGVPAPDASAAWTEATSRCSSAQALSAELRLSGRAGTVRIPRATVFTGITSDGQIRLEAPAPFGRPGFLLAGTAQNATLVLRDDRVVEAPAARILDALVGLSFDPASLLTVLTGCGLSRAPIVDAVRYTDLLAVQTDQGRAFLRSVAGHWRVVAVQRDGLLVDYVHDPSRSEVWPRELRLTSLPGRNPALTLSVSQDQIEVNVPFPPRAFTVTVPAGATAMTVEELRSAGPLGDQR